MMTSIKLDGKIKRCAFCKYWYDPTNQHIKPHDPKHNWWKFDSAARCMCTLKSLNMSACLHCNKFESKV